MTSSLGRRLGLGFAAIGIGTALLTALVVNLAFSSRFDSYLAQQRSTQVQQVAEAVTTVYEATGGWDAARLSELEPALAMAGADVRLLGPTGDPIWRTGQGASPMAEMHRSMTPAVPRAEPISVTITTDGQERGTVLVSLPEGSVPVADQQFRASVNGLLLAGGLLVAVLASVLGLLLARRVTRPIAELTDATRELRAGDRGRRAQVTGRDEVAQLARAFNELAESAQRQEALRQSFAADVAHELRTPLAILRSQLEGVQDGVVESSPALITSLHEEALRLGRLVADLETLTSAEAVSFSLEHRDVDLSDVVRSVLAGFDARLADADLRLERRLVPAPVCGDPVRLGQVVTNLLTNAVKFVPAGGQVTVSTEAGADRVRLTVRDDGRGIPEDELPHVFDRYFRGSRARANGSGIGLAVVAALVQAHGGRVLAGNHRDGGAVITVDLPPAADGDAGVHPLAHAQSPPAGRAGPGTEDEEGAHAARTGRPR